MEVVKASKMLTEQSFYPKFLIIGSSGGGKTTALTTFPPEWKVLVLDFFGNKESLEGSSNVEVVSYSELDPRDPMSYITVNKDMDEIISMTAEGKGWDGICIDTLTGLIRFTEAYILITHPEKKGIGGSPAQHHYRGLSHIVGEFLMSFIGIPCAIVLNAHADTVEDKGGGLVHYQAMISGKRWRNNIYSYLGEVYRAFGEPSDKIGDDGEPITEFYWQTQPDELWPMLKSVMNQRLKYWGKYVDPNYTKLLKRRGVIQDADEG